INLLVRVHGMAQLYLIGAGQELQLYVSPVNWRPDNPPAPMSSPASFAADLYERLGPFRTLGWAEATWPLNEDRIDERTFMEVMSRVDPGTPILIVSDHGFHSFRQSVNLNTWLVQEGFMAIQGQQPGEKKLQDLFGGGTFWKNVDWTRTRAYAMGLGQIYLNLKGREGHGVVPPGDSNAVQDDLVARLLTMTDPKTGAPMVTAVYKRDDIYKGPFVH